MKREEMLQNNEDLSKGDIALLVKLLNRCEPGNLPSEVFEAVAKIAVYPAVELVVFRKNSDLLEVLVTKRLDDDPVWPAMHHLPGTVLRPTDSSIDDAIKRLFDDELNGADVKSLQFTGVFFNVYTRGKSIGLEYWLEVTGGLSVGTFYDVEKLPNNFIPEQIIILERAVSARASKQGTKS